MDFTLKIYRRLLQAFHDTGYSFQTIADFLTHPEERAVILRHDVDRKPDRAAKMARMEHGCGIVGTYYFRCRRGQFPVQEIGEVAALGHEIGYHYEDYCRARGDIQTAIASFEKNLSMLRNLVPVKTICMHGSPLSTQDNLCLWNLDNYRRLGIIGEPYLDIDYSCVQYLSDTGRSWGWEKVRIRDRVAGCSKTVCGIHKTCDIIAACQNGGLADQIMIAVHPQRWESRFFPWVMELILQNLKNPLKVWLLRRRSAK